jgi:predicted DCC family thiol-disulfide oxidoreductase YuxK
MHAVTDTGRITAGFDAVRAVASRLPLFWPLALIGYFPGVAWAGRRVYNRVAANRPRDVACTDQVCGIHLQSPRAAPRDGGRARAHHNPIAITTDTEEVPRL